MSEMPYRRDETHCELCGEPSLALRRIVIQESQGRLNSNYKCARVAWVCPAHDDAGGLIVKTPQRGMAPGTSTKQPQKETLW